MEGDAVGADYTDFHTLIKPGETWRIAAKVYYVYEGEPGTMARTTGIRLDAGQ